VVERGERGAQDDDGYIGLFTGAARGSGSYLEGDLWTQSRVLGALQAWAEYTQDGEVDDAVTRALDCCAARFADAVRSGESVGRPTDDGCARGHDLMIVEVAVEQARRTSATQLVEFASSIYGEYSRSDLEWPYVDGRLDTLLSAAPVIGHGAHTAEHLRVPLLLAEMTGDPNLTAAFENGYHKIVGALGVGGALKSDETISAPGGGPYPLAEAGYEFCAITELALSLLEGARITGSFEYLDRVERLFLNATQAALAKDGRSTAYLVADNQAAATREMGTRWDYSPTHDDVAVCCVPNAARILPIIAERMVMQSDAGLSVHLYGPMETSTELSGSTIVLRQETAFPFDAHVIIHVGADDVRFDVELRIPAWCAEFTVETTGASDVTEEWQGDRVRLTGTWGPRSQIRVSLPQALRTVRAVDGRVALVVGPLVYSVPIAHHAVPQRKYSVGGYADLDLVPDSPELMYPPVLMEHLLGEAHAMLAAGSRTDPWIDPGFHVIATCLNPNPRLQYDDGGPVDVCFVPLGTTALRWTALTAAPQ